MSVAPNTTPHRPQPTDELEAWSPKALGWRLLFSDRLLWLALGISFIGHLIILAPRYGIKLPERSDKLLTVSFRAASQAPPQSNRQTPSVTSKTPSPRKPARPDVIKPVPIPSATATSNTILLGAADLASRAASSPSTVAPNQTASGSNGSGRRVALNANTKDYRYSQYLSDWRNKVERIGAMNYPEEARGRFFGSLVLSVALRPDGSVDRIMVVRSSGNKVLDDAAKRIVMMASPFAPFPPDIRKETDYLDITRTWNFTRGDALETR